MPAGGKSTSLDSDRSLLSIDGSETEEVTLVNFMYCSKMKKKHWAPQKITVIFLNFERHGKAIQ